jgi:hypothetical protein
MRRGSAAVTSARSWPPDCDPIFIRDGRVWTSAGVTAGMDLSLALVEEDLGRDIAHTVAQQMVMFLRRPGSQSQFSVPLWSAQPRTDPIRAAVRPRRTWPMSRSAMRSWRPAPDDAQPRVRPGSASSRRSPGAELSEEYQKAEEAAGTAVASGTVTGTGWTARPA